MNATVKRIVEVMFQGKPATDELTALKDEVMNNCQERYDDMIARGVTEDEAIAAVVESLKGMEEVIAERAAAAAAVEAVPEDREATYAPEDVSRIRVSLRADDVNVEASRDGLVHVNWDRQAISNLRTRLNGGVLEIDRDFTVTDDIKEKKTKPIEEWKSIGDLLDAVGAKLVSIGRHFTQEGGAVTIAVPEDCGIMLEAHLIGGDLTVEDAPLAGVAADTVSGDVDVCLDGDLAVKSVDVKTASGDVDVRVRAASVNVGTMSGDVDVKGACESLTINTVSGDADADASARCITMKSVSGDMNVRADERLAQVRCATTSGDVELCLPCSFSGRAAVTLNTVSGDVESFLAPLSGPASLEISLQSVSGDLTICE